MRFANNVRNESFIIFLMTAERETLAINYFESVFAKIKRSQFPCLLLQISMMLHNTGQDITYNLTSGHVILSGGPLSYDYQLFGAMIKFGRNSARGSEHHINGVPFPGEVSTVFSFCET